MYQRLWSKSGINCQKRPKVNLNGVLAIAADQINRNKDEKEEIAKRKIYYLQKMYMDSDYPMSDEVADKKLEQLIQRVMKIQFQHQDDIKFRFGPLKFKWFYTHVEVIHETIQKYPQLKEFLYLDHPDFKFSKNYLESKMEFMHYHEKQIINTEKNENCEFNNLWTLITCIFVYALNHGNDRVPLADAFRQ